MYTLISPIYNLSRNRAILPPTPSWLPPLPLEEYRSNGSKLFVLSSQLFDLGLIVPITSAPIHIYAALV